MDKPVRYDSANNFHPAAQEIVDLKGSLYLLYQLIRRDILTRYKRSVLGVAWTMLNPLGTMIILTIVFSQLFKSVDKYPIYILSGLMSWIFFSQSTNGMMHSLVWGSGLLKRVFIPPSIFGLSAVGMGLINLLISIIPLLLIMLITGAEISTSILFLPIPIILTAFFTLGFGLFLSGLAVFYPDVAEMYQVLLNGWMYLTPIVYPESIIPEHYRALFILNPMYSLIKIFRLPIYDGRIPTFNEMLPAIIWAVGMLLIGWFSFTRKSDEFAYKI